MTRVRRINVSQVEGRDANNTNDDEIRPFGEAAIYIDNDGGPTDKPVLTIHDGTRTHLRSKVVGPGVLYGSNTDAGDGSGTDTIKLIPDSALHYNGGGYGNDQYIVVDPTGGDPGHIHLRAGGTQDASTADLYLGGELTCVRVSDTSGIVTVRTTSVGDPNITKDWAFESDGNLYFPGIGNNRIGESEPGLVVSSDNNVVLQSNNNGESKNWTFGTDGSITLPNNGVIRVDGNNIEVGNLNNFNVEAGGVVNIYTATDAVTPHQWQFGDDGSLTFPNDVKITTGGIMDQNAINFVVPDSVGSNTNYQWSFDASYGIPYLRFPDGTIQGTALKTESIGQVGYRLMFDTDIYANETGGAVNSYQTSVLLESNAQLRALFQIAPLATSTTARAYNHPTNFGEIILEVTTVTGAPIDLGMAVWAIVDGTPTPIGDIDTQQDPTTWILIGAPLLAEVVIGTEFEFYGGGFASYTPTQTIVLEWSDGTETEVVEGITNNPYSIGVDLVTAEDQTTLNYPMILMTADYEPAEFSHVIDADNNFKITTRADDFILNSDEGPLVIRNATSEFIFESNTLTVPGTISLEGIGGVVGFASGEATFIGIEGTTGWGVALRATDSQLDSKNWLFNIDGTLKLPVSAYGYAQLYTNGTDNLLLGSATHPVTINGSTGTIQLAAGADIVDSNGVSVLGGGSTGDITFSGDSVIGTEGRVTFGDAQNTVAIVSDQIPVKVQINDALGDPDQVWLFGVDGSVTFPDSTVQTSAWTKRIVAVPTSSTGTTGDLQGDLAFNATYMYYCTQNFSGTVITIASISSDNPNPYLIMYDSNTGWTSADLTGYTVTGPGGYTGTVTGPSTNQGVGLYYIPVTPNVTQTFGDYTFTSPGGNIWKRVAWSGDTW